MKYVCEPFSDEIASLQAERKALEAQLGAASGEEKSALSAKMAEIDRQLAGLQQSLADCLARPDHFKEIPDPRSPRKP